MAVMHGAHASDNAYEGGEDSVCEAESSDHA